MPLILIVFAFVLAVIAGLLVPTPEPWRWPWRLICFYLACFYLAEVIARAPSFHFAG